MPIPEREDSGIEAEGETMSTCATCGHHDAAFPIYQTQYFGDSWVRSTIPEFPCKLRGDTHFASNYCPQHTDNAPAPDGQNAPLDREQGA